MRQRHSLPHVIDDTLRTDGEPGKLLSFVSQLPLAWSSISITSGRAPGVVPAVPRDPDSPHWSSEPMLQADRRQLDLHHFIHRW